MNKLSTGRKGTMAVLALLGIAAFVAWIYQQIGGLGVTGMSNGTSWGLYIACFMFFVGLSAGGLIVASSASVFHIKEYKKVALPAIMVSTVCICLAGAFVLIDLGGIYRVWELLVMPNFTSPLMWDICVITLYLVINIVYLVFMVSSKADERKVSICSRFALPTAILVHSITAWIFGLQIAREGWYSALMAPLFVISAMDSGLALLLIVLVSMNKLGWFKTDKKLISNLAGLMATCIALDGYFVGSEVLTMAYPGAGGAETLALMTSGPTAFFFWFEIIVGVLIPFFTMLFKQNRARTGLVVFSSICVICGVFCKRVWLLFTSFFAFNVSGAPGVSSGSTVARNATGPDIWSTVGAYAPTAVEIIIVVGVIAVGVLAFMIMAQKMLPGAAHDASPEKSEVRGVEPAAEAV